MPRSCWVDTPKTTYNSRTAHGTATKPGRSTVLGTPVRNLENHGCKPLVTKLASVLHARLRVPQLCSLRINKIHRNCHMICGVTLRTLPRGSYSKLHSNVWAHDEWRVLTQSNTGAHDRRVLSNVGGTFLKHHFWNNWSVPTQREWTIGRVHTLHIYIKNCG